MRYFVIGEDIPKTEITAEQAANVRDEDDYRVIVADDDGTPVHNPARPAAPTEPAPAWVPFDFGPAPKGYIYTGYTIQWYDGEGFEGTLDEIPKDAVKLSAPNRWKWYFGAGGERLISAVSNYEIIKTEACPACAGCTRYTCVRRQNGPRCRNYKH